MFLLQVTPRKKTPRKQVTPRKLSPRQMRLKKLAKRRLAQKKGNKQKQRIKHQWKKLIVDQAEDADTCSSDDEFDEEAEIRAQKDFIHDTDSEQEEYTPFNCKCFICIVCNNGIHKKFDLVPGLC